MCSPLTTPGRKEVVAMLAGFLITVTANVVSGVILYFVCKRLDKRNRRER